MIPAEKIRRESHSKSHLSATFRTAEQQGVGNTTFGNHLPQSLLRFFLTYDFTELHIITDSLPPHLLNRQPIPYRNVCCVYRYHTIRSEEHTSELQSPDQL